MVVQQSFILFVYVVAGVNKFFLKSAVILACTHVSVARSLEAERPASESSKCRWCRSFTKAWMLEIRRQLRLASIIYPRPPLLVFCQSQAVISSSEGHVRIQSLFLLRKSNEGWSGSVNDLESVRAFLYSVFCQYWNVCYLMLLSRLLQFLAFSECESDFIPW
jgi:hypothetical protein